MMLKRIFAWLSLTGLSLSFVVHSATFMNINLTQHWPQLWAVHLGILLVFLPFILLSRSLVRDQKQYWSQLLAPMPDWAGRIIKLVFGYMLFNFGCLVYQYWQGQPFQINGEYWLQVHGQPSLLNLDELSRLKLLETRQFSGHWLFFYLLPSLYFSYHRHSSTKL